MDALPRPAPCGWRPQTHHTKAGRPCEGKGGRPARPRPRGWRPGQSPRRPFPSQAPDTKLSSGMAQPACQPRASQGTHPPGALSPLRRQPTGPTHTTAWSDCRKRCSETGSKTSGENSSDTCPGGPQGGRDKGPGEIKQHKKAVVSPRSGTNQGQWFKYVHEETEVGRVG